MEKHSHGRSYPFKHGLHATFSMDVVFFVRGWCFDSNMQIAAGSRVLPTLYTKLKYVDGGATNGYFWQPVTSSEVWQSPFCTRSDYQLPKNAWSRSMHYSRRNLREPQKKIISRNFKDSKKGIPASVPFSGSAPKINRVYSGLRHIRCSGFVEIHSVVFVNACLQTNKRTQGKTSS